jgi:hypothetical protein
MFSNKSKVFAEASYLSLAVLLSLTFSMFVLMNAEPHGVMNVLPAHQLGVPGRLVNI